MDGIYFSRGKLCSGKNLVTKRNFSHFSLTKILKLVAFPQLKFPNRSLSATKICNGTQFLSIVELESDVYKKRLIDFLCKFYIKYSKIGWNIWTDVKKSGENVVRENFSYLPKELVTHSRLFSPDKLYVLSTHSPLPFCPNWKFRATTVIYVYLWYT